MPKQPSPTRAARSTLFGYAVLRANYNHSAPSYLDNFTGFVIDVLAQHHPQPLSEAEVGAAVRDNFGLTIPDRVAGVLLRRAVKDGKAVGVEAGSYAATDVALGGLASLDASIAEYEQKQATLRRKFVDYVRDEHPERLVLVEDEPEAVLHEFVERHAAPLLRRAVKGGRGRDARWDDLQGPDYLVAAFISRLAETDPTVFGYVVETVKGAILTGVLDVGHGDLHRNLHGLTVVLDTPVLLSLLGYQGEVQRRAVGQTVQLAKSLGVKVVCFEHTEREIDGVLESVARVLRNPGRATGPLRAVDTHFIDRRASAADVLVEQDRLRAGLQEAGVRVVPRPDDYAAFGLDEDALDGLLAKRLPTQRQATRRFDVESLSAVHRLREGSSPAQFERCRFVFVTSNVGLVQAAREVDERHQWPLVMLDAEIASLLWVRSPAVAEDLPRDQLLATVYAGMQPNGHLWVKYVQEIETLEQRGSVDAQEALVLKVNPEARRALMDVTLGEADAVDAASVGEVVDRVRESLEAPMRQVVDLARLERDRAVARAAHEQDRRSETEQEQARLQGVVAALQDERTRQEDRIKADAARRAKRTVLRGVLAVALVLVLLGLGGLVPRVAAHLPHWAARLALGSGLLVLAVGQLRNFVGGSVKEWLAFVEKPLARRYEKRARMQAGLAVE